MNGQQTGGGMNCLIGFGRGGGGLKRVVACQEPIKALEAGTSPKICVN